MMLDDLLHDTERRLESRCRALEKENRRLLATLDIRFDELGTLTRLMQERVAERQARLEEAREKAKQEIAELLEDNARLEQDQVNLMDRIACLETELSVVYSSRFWRITRPLRWIMHFIKRVKT